MGLRRRLYLASASPRRVDLLTLFGLAFHQIPNLLKDETLDVRYGSVRSQLRQLCEAKGTASKQELKGLILSADTIVVLEDAILGKPKSLAHAGKMLHQMSGKTHQVISGFCLLDTIRSKTIKRTEVTTVEFNRLTSDEITDYCNRFSPLDKAGAYGIQEVQDGFVKEIQGSFFNVMGLPIKLLLRILRDYDIV